MPTPPLHQGCAAIHSTMSWPSSRSRGSNGCGFVPSEAPVPRKSTCMTA